MAYTVTTDTITVHGRSSLSIPYEVFTVTNGVEAQADLSGRTYYFEISGAHIRKLVGANPGDARGLVIELTRAEVESLHTKPMKFALVDETDPVRPFVEWAGDISRNGFVGAP